MLDFIHVLAVFLCIWPGTASAQDFEKFLKMPYMQDQLQRSFTAYGPGLGVFTPYSYVDLFYDNIPFIGKIPLIGKDGTSSRTGISPFYPVGGNPSNPLPPLYKARPLPIHAPDPVEVVAVPLDEEALHGEKLFPDELVLPWLRETAADPSKKNQKPKGDKAPNPFGDISDSDADTELDDDKLPVPAADLRPGKVEKDSAEFESREAIRFPTFDEVLKNRTRTAKIEESDSSEYEDDSR